MCDDSPMSAPEDPEARIRDLERPLSESARAAEQRAVPYAEQGSVPYTEQSAGPYAEQSSGQPGYNATHLDWNTTAPIPPPPRRSGSRAALAVFVFAVIACALGAGLLAYLLIGRGPVPSGQPGGHFPSAGPVAEEPIPALPARPDTPPAVPVPAAAPGTTITVAGAEEHRTLACAGHTVVISGVSNIIDITGTCAAVVVSGIENEITVDESASIRVSGISNRITYRVGDPDVGNSGLGNVVEPG